MPTLATLIPWLDSRPLNTRGIVDYPGAHNGLQLENAGTVTRRGRGGRFVRAVLAQAVERGIDLLLVHHGLLWQPRALHRGALIAS